MRIHMKPLSDPKKVTLAVLTAIGMGVFVAAWILEVYWSLTRLVPVPALGRVVERTSHGGRFYLTLTESQLVSEPVFGGALLVMFVTLVTERFTL